MKRVAALPQSNFSPYFLNYNCTVVPRRKKFCLYKMDVIATKALLILSIVTVAFSAQIENCVWTQWTDHDNPGEFGDWETIKSWPEDRRCPTGSWPQNVMDIEARRISDKAPAYFTGQSFRYYDTTTGFACVNSRQAGECHDYEARLCCSLPQTDSCTLLCPN